ncbi:MAG: hypothetical protein ACD_60C00057G0029 [uncultured bacterium]|nr:MAG: hypothetical protein ACD_60C00057G0029 [uncultured bacterium]
MVMIAGPAIYSEEGIVENAALDIEGTKIKAIIPENKIRGDSLTFPKNYHLVPGFIDVHIHGANGSDVMDGDFHALETISHALAEEGTTSFLATTMTAAPDAIEKALMNIHAFMQKQEKMDGARILGAHLEGPFLSAKKIGAQPAAYILPPNSDDIKQWQKISGHCIKLITLAPELKDALKLIHFLKEEGIVASVGHTDATYAESIAAIDAGCSHVTHLFNAMRGIHQREPGTVTAALLRDKVSTELIVDGVHLHPAIVELIFKIKNKEKIILVTDAMRAKCLADDTYELGGQTIHVKNQIAKLPDGTLAGSTLKMFTALKNMIQFTQCSFFDAIKCASENPAKMLNIFDKKGSIAAGKDADLVVLDDQLNVVLTMCMGKIVINH